MRVPESWRLLLALVSIGACERAGAPPPGGDDASDAPADAAGGDGDSDGSAGETIGEGSPDTSGEVPGDGGGEAASDAAIADAAADAGADTPPADRPPEAWMNTPPTLVLTPPTNPIIATAGDMVTISASAIDPDTMQTLTYGAPWPGTNKDPYAVRMGTDSVGGVFSAITMGFALPAGVLGIFDVEFRVSDGIASDSKRVTINVLAHPVRLNEVQIGPADAQQNIELVNTGTAAVDLSGWAICVPFEYFTFPVGATIGPGGFLVVRWRQTGTSTATEIYTGTLATGSLATVQEILLYQTAIFSRSREIRDFVKWGAGNSRAVQAVFAGQWPGATASDHVDMTGFSNGRSIARTPGSNTESRVDWYVEAVPTLGGANVP